MRCFDDGSLGRCMPHALPGAEEHVDQIMHAAMLPGHLHALNMERSPLLAGGMATADALWRTQSVGMLPAQFLGAPCPLAVSLFQELKAVSHLCVALQCRPPCTRASTTPCGLTCRPWASTPW